MCRLSVALELSSVVILTVATSAHAADFSVTAPPADMKLDAVYKKYVDANGYPVVGSERVNDYALKEAAYLINMMLAKRPDVRDAMVNSGSRIIVMSHDEFTTDVPEHSHLDPKDFWDARARGLGGSETDPVCSCGEENLLAFEGDPYDTECILIHEFAHNIHLRGLVRVDPTFDDRVQAAWKNALARGLWVNKYASTNHHEYFAEGVQSWFNNNREPDHDHNHVNTRRELREYDKGLADLCDEVFGDTDLVYSKPATRLTGHLDGYDPAMAPEFVWPERLDKTWTVIKDKAKNRGRSERKKPTAALKHEVRDIEGWTVHVDVRLLSGPGQETGRTALRILRDKLYRISLVVPDGRVERLRDVHIHLDFEHGLRSMQYHPGVDWLQDHGYDPGLVKCVHIPRAQGLIDHFRRTDQPWVMLHELAHAYHDQVLGFEDETIREVWQRFVDTKKYDSVLHMSGRRRKHYALTNHKEFFAEMTEAYFGTNDFYPFVRGELRDALPEVYQLLDDVWRKPTKP